MAIRSKSWIAALLLAGCTVGPDFVPPTVIAPVAYRDGASPYSTIENAPVDPAWWHLLGDPLLDSLVERVAAENLDVQTATARLDESRAQRGITAADLYPHLDGNASYTREKLSDRGVISLVGGSGGAGGGMGGGTAGGQNIPIGQATAPFNIYQYGIDATWELDLWGRVRRGIEGADATILASAEARCAATLSAMAEMVTDYAQLRGSQAMRAAIQRDADDALMAQRLTAAKARAGLATQVDIINANAQVNQTQAQIPQLDQQIAQAKNAMALLLGLMPGALDDQLDAAKPLPLLPVSVPVGVPSELALRRPDVRQAEAQLHAATAQIGVATANFYPKVTLMGDGMLQSLNFHTLNTLAAGAYSLGPSISLPIFEGGQLVSTLALDKASQREAAIQYRKSVLTAFHEVDNALTAFRAEQARAITLNATVAQDRQARDLALSLYRAGLGDFITVLTDEQNALVAEQQAIQSRETALADMVQLYKALGGGWESAFQRDPAAKGDGP